MSQLRTFAAIQPDAVRSGAEMTDSATATYRRAVDYLAPAQVCLKSNALLEGPLNAEDIKDRLLGNWGTCPGIHPVHAHPNGVILRTDASVFPVTGPGHGAAANLANTYLNGSPVEFYPGTSRDRAGSFEPVKRFPGPGGFLSRHSDRNFCDSASSILAEGIDPPDITEWARH